MCHANIEEFKRIITKIYEKTLTNNSGKVADYIPQLAQVNPDLYGIRLSRFMRLIQDKFEICR